MKKSKINKVTMLLVLLFLVAAVPACAKKPVLYPNPHYQKVGKTQADQDVTFCLKFADENIGKESRGKNAAKTGAKGGLIGAAAGLGIGLVTGNPGKALEGAAGGAAGGAAVGALKSTEDSAYRNFVNRCLREKGYEVSGWR